MPEKLNALMMQLRVSIDESLKESERIAEAISEIQKAGYDFFLTLEATMRLIKREGSEIEQSSIDNSEVPEISLNPQDVKFFRALKIKVD